MSTYGECTICMEEIVSLNADLNVLTTCGHTYHRACVEEWIKKEAHCPQCRVPCIAKDVKPLFFNSVDKWNVPNSSGGTDRAHLVVQLRQEAEGRRARIADLEMTVHETEELQDITRGEIEEANGKLQERAHELDEAAIVAVGLRTTIDQLTADGAKVEEDIRKSVGDEMDVLRAANEQLHARYNGQNADVAKSKELLAASREENYRLAGQIATLRKQLQAAEAGSASASRPRLAEIGNTTKSKGSMVLRGDSVDEPPSKITKSMSTPSVRGPAPQLSALMPADDV